MAQGGIAAAMDPADHPDAHARDTFLAGERLGDPARIRQLVYDAPERIHELLRLGAQFDRGPHGELALGLEGAHGFRRILHAHGDQTGAELVRVLRQAVRSHPGIRILEAASVISLLTATNSAGRPVQVTGARVRMASGDVLTIPARVTLLATGGAGRLYQWTTNPAWAWGDGVALGMQVGAWLAGMEFVQFHPTALRVAADPLPLVTEALRGEGARLVDGSGRLLFEGGSDSGEGDLAPRHRVTRALWRQRQEGREVFLDARDAVGEAFPIRFPWIYQACIQVGVDPVRDLIPVTPAAHYLMGGIAADAEGRTSVMGLRVAGEVAWTGVHGANRLASNSLLEGLVFGTRSGRSVAMAGSLDEAVRAARPGALGPLARPFLMDEGATLKHGRPGGAATVPSASATPSSDDLEGRLRAIMWDRVGVERSSDGLRDARRMLEQIVREVHRCEQPDRHALFLGRVRVAQAMTQAALLRSESLGSHQRIDGPNPPSGWVRAGVRRGPSN